MDLDTPRGVYGGTLIVMLKVFLNLNVVTKF